MAREYQTLQNPFCRSPKHSEFQSGKHKVDSKVDSRVIRALMKKLKVDDGRPEELIRKVGELVKKDKYNTGFINKYLEMIGGFCPPQIKEKDINLKFATANVLTLKHDSEDAAGLMISGREASSSRVPWAPCVHDHCVRRSPSQRAATFR